MMAIKHVFTKSPLGAFRRNLPNATVNKAYMITLLSACVVCIGSFLMCILEPEYNFIQLLFEVISAFGTVGLSTGITPDLSDASKLLITAIMFIGRLGAFTIFSIWIERPEANARYTEETITIG